MSNQLQKPFSDIIGEKSLVQRMLKLAWHFTEIKPETVANTTESKSASALILTHLLGLMESAGLINLSKEKLEIMIAPELLRIKN